MEKFVVEVPKIIPGGFEDYLMVVSKGILVISLKLKSRIINKNIKSSLINPTLEGGG